MKVFNYTKRILPLLLLIFIFAACEEDLGGILTQDEAPSTGIIAEGGYVIGSATVETETAFKVKFSANSGTSNLKSVSIREDGSLVDFSRIKINGSAVVANPILLFTPDTEGFIWDVELISHTDEATKDYTFGVSDDLNLTSDVVVAITTMAQMPVPPSMEFLGNTSIMATPGSLISIPLNVMAGNKPISHIAVSEGSEFIEDLTRLYLGDTNTNFTDNPHPLELADQDGFEKNIYIKASNDPGTKSYRIFIVDGNSDGAFVDFNVTTGTPVSLIEGILFNAAGVTGTGGLDLDDGIGLGSRDLAAEIKDEGIDLDQPIANNWKQQISGVNGAEIRYALAGQNGIPEGFTFTGVSLTEEIQSAFESGMQFDLSNGDDESTSYQLSEGDVLSVKSGNKYYLVQIREINVVTNGNADHYVIDIKQ